MLIDNNILILIIFINRFGKRKSASIPVPSIISKSRIHHYNDPQRISNNMLNRIEDDESYKLQFKLPVISNSKDLYDMLFSSRRENGNNNRHQYYLMQQDVTNSDINLD